MLGRITRVRLENYRSIRHCDVELGNFNFLIGPNGAGKSNFVDALSFVSEALLGSLNQPLNRRGGIVGCLHHHGVTRAAALSIALDFEDALGNKGSYGFELASENTVDAVIANEFCQWNGHTGFGGEHVLKTPADRLALSFFGALPQWAAALDLLSHVRVYAPDVRRLKAPFPQGSAPVLECDASNLASVFRRIQEANPPTAGRINDYLAALAPDIRYVEVAAHRNYDFLTFDRGVEATMLNESVSDGTLRALAILVALFQARVLSRSLSVVAIEEPENNIHPAAASLLFDAMSEASASVQVIATTHSADMLDRKSVEGLNILAVQMERGETIIGPIDDVGRSVVKDKLFTVGELMRMNQIHPTPRSSSV